MERSRKNSRNKNHNESNDTNIKSESSRVQGKTKQMTTMGQRKTARARSERCRKTGQGARRRKRFNADDHIEADWIS